MTVTVIPLHGAESAEPAVRGPRESIRPGPPGPLIPSAIGVVCPHDMVLDRELWRWTPTSVTLLCTRTPHEAVVVDESLISRMAGDHVAIRAAALSLSAAQPGAMVYACTSASFVAGLAGARALSEDLAVAGTDRCATTSEALVAALDHLGVSRVAVATPYIGPLTDRLGVFLREVGKDVVGIGGLGLDGGIWRTSYREVCELIRRVDTPDAEAVVVACTNLPTYDVLARMENELGKPVVSANQATMWWALRAVGLRGRGAGQSLFLSGSARRGSPGAATDHPAGEVAAAD